MGRLGIAATWTANVANRKLNVWSQGQTPAVEAQASATAGETKRLDGNNPWRQGKRSGLAKSPETASSYPRRGASIGRPKTTIFRPTARTRSDNGVLDTTSDGSISVSLAGAGNLPIVPACVIVAPQDHSPDVGPEHVNPTDSNANHNKDFVKGNKAAAEYSRKCHSGRSWL